VEYLIGILAVSVTTAGSLVLILFLDRFEKDPLWLLTLVFLWGAVAVWTALCACVWACVFWLCGSCSASYWITEALNFH